MKNIIAILLLALLVFNWFGYRALTSFCEDRADRQLESSLDENQYDESQLLSIKIPSPHISVYSNVKPFVRVSGKVDIDGVTYNYVKWRAIGDSLELRCIPNKAVTELRTAKNDFFKLTNELQNKAGKKSGTSLSKKIVMADVDSNHTALKFTPCSVAIAARGYYYTDALAFYFFSPIENPPEKML